jgi:hypothetical protein
MAMKYDFFPNFFAHYFLKLHLHHFFKIKSNKEVTKKVSRFFLLILLDDRRIRIPNTNPDPGQPNQCGSMRIRIQKLPAISPQIFFA